MSNAEKFKRWRRLLADTAEIHGERLLRASFERGDFYPNVTYTSEVSFSWGDIESFNSTIMLSQQSSEDDAQSSEDDAMIAAAQGAIYAFSKAVRDAAVKRANNARSERIIAEEREEIALERWITMHETVMSWSKKP